MSKLQKTVGILASIKNNLPYTKFFYQTTRQLYPEIEIVFVSYGSTDGTHEWLDSLADENLKYSYGTGDLSLSEKYNLCIEIASSEYVVLAHNDMVLGQGFIENLIEFANDKSVLFYRVIEPPVFPDDKYDWKIVKDFGENVHDFKQASFQSFVSNQVIEKPRKTKDPIFFFCIKKSILTMINGFDILFAPMFCEDHDLLLRLKMLELRFIIVTNALAYHFVSKTSRFSEEFINKTQIIEENSIRNFYRKWGFSSICKLIEKRNIGLIAPKIMDESVKELEPYFNTIYTNIDFSNYITEEQYNTIINLGPKFKLLSETKTNDVLVSFSGKKCNVNQQKVFKNMIEEIKTYLTRRKGLFDSFRLKNRFRRKGITFHIIRDQTYERDLIYRK